jgi:3-dehydroquinate synthase
MKLSQVEHLKSITDLFQRNDQDYFYIIDTNVQLSSFPKNSILIKNAEESKNLVSANKIIDELLEKGLTPKSVLVSIGGGAISDLTGFLASILFRGIKFESIPSTLLSMIDAGIGGKNALNTNFSKNTIGTIYLPQKIYLYKDFLKTLSMEEHKSGLGELLKYALLDQKIASSIGNDLDNIISVCIEYKHQIIAKDLHDKNIRKILNLGHTLGHAFEAEFGLKHGLAITLGLYFELKFFSPEKLKEFHKFAEQLKLANYLDWLKEFKIENLISRISLDKKRITSFVEMPIFQDNKIELKKISITEIENKINGDEELKHFIR